MRVAIIGAGAQGRRHAKAFRAAGAEIAGIAASSTASAAAAAGGLQLDAYTTAGAAIADDRVDAIVVATPTATHPEIVVSALQAGKHVLCEVPVAHDVAEAHAMERAADRAGRVLQAALLHRFEAVWTAFVGIVQAGELGRPVHLVTERLSAFEADGLMRPHHGDAIDELLAFDIHLLLWALGLPESIAADATWRDGRVVRVAAAFSRGDACVTCFATQEMPGGYPFTERATVTFERGRVEALNRFWPDRVETRLVRHLLDGPAEDMPLAPGNVFIEQARHFIDTCGGRADPAYAALAHACAVLDVAQAVRRVSRQGSSRAFPSQPSPSEPGSPTVRASSAS